MDYIEAVSGNVMEYNARIFDYDWNPPEEATDWCLANSSRISDFYKAIHIDKSPKRPIYEAGSEAVSKAYKSDGLVDYS